MNVTRFCAIAAMTLLAACSGEPKTAEATHSKHYQISQVQWDELTAAPTAAEVSNNGLIMMR